MDILCFCILYILSFSSLLLWTYMYATYAVFFRHYMKIPDHAAPCMCPDSHLKLRLATSYQRYSNYYHIKTEITWWKLHGENSTPHCSHFFPFPMYTLYTLFCTSLLMQCPQEHVRHFKINKMQTHMLPRGRSYRQIY